MEEKLKEQIQSLFSRLDDIKYDNTPEHRLLSKIYGLDKKVSGFKFGEITIWTGTTNAGKTTLLTQLARNIIEQGERIFFFNR